QVGHYSGNQGFGRWRSATDRCNVRALGSHVHPHRFPSSRHRPMTCIPRSWLLLVSLSAVRQVAAQAPTPASADKSAPARDPVSQVVRRLNWRSVGPANNAGRISVVVGVPGDPYTYYVAGANGGIIRTTNGGTTFKPVFDKQDISSIGAIAIAPSDPNV